MSPAVIVAVLSLLMELLKQAPELTAEVQAILDHKGPWTAEEADAWTARLKALLAADYWQPKEG
jgi:hypothetical protein